MRFKIIKALGITMLGVVIKGLSVQPSTLAFVFGLALYRRPIGSKLFARTFPALDRSKCFGNIIQGVLFSTLRTLNLKRDPRAMVEPRDMMSGLTLTSHPPLLEVLLTSAPFVPFGTEALSAFEFTAWPRLEWDKVDLTALNTFNLEERLLLASSFLGTPWAPTFSKTFPAFDLAPRSRLERYFVRTAALRTDNVE